MEIENLFIWKKPETRWERAKSFTVKELSTFWADKWNLRSGFIYATWGVIGLWYLDMMGINMFIGEWKVAAAQIGMIMWFGLWCIEAYFHRETRAMLHRTFKSWAESLESWGQTARITMKLEQENKRLQERIDNMLGTEGK